MSQIAEHVKSIFLEAVEKHEPDDWPKFLDEACGDDDKLRQRVEGLLQAHAEEDSLFDAADLTADYFPSIGPGQRIGPYRLREKLGEGAFGIVWAAERKEPVRLKVAIKVIKSLDESVIARFEAERNALSLMDHPNIARVFDAGKTEQGHPYFVMELVNRGVPITRYCDEHRLTISERLKLFAQVCHAVHHAHQKAIIHRDIKPTNVLVISHDGVPVPKVIDFGVAKAMGQDLTSETVYTFANQIIGTLPYMSPEQAGLSGIDADTRSDVYSLGVLLYELLSGTTPFAEQQLAKVAILEACRIIQEQDPPRISTRLSSLGESATELSASRRIGSRELQQLCARDLDWIVAKALEKDRTRRYDSAASFARDVSRHLDREPVEARPPSATYRIGKLVQRHRMACYSVVAIAMALMLGAGISTWQAFRASAFARQAENARVVAEEESKRNLQLRYESDIVLAGQAWDEGNLREFNELMARLRANLTESYPAPFEQRLLLERKRRSHRAADYTVGSVCTAMNFSPDGRWLAASMANDRTKLIDLIDGSETTLRGGSRTFGRGFVSFDSASNQLIYGKSNGTAKAFELSTGDSRTLKSEREIKKLVFIPGTTNQRLVAVAYADGTIEVRDVDFTLPPTHTWKTGNDLNDLSISSDGKLLTAVHQSGSAETWSLESYQSIGRFEFDPAASRVAISPRGNVLATAKNHNLRGDFAIELWDPRSGRLVHRLAGHGAFVHDLLFSRDGKYLASGGRDNTIRIWEVRGGQQIGQLRGHSGYVTSLALSPDGRRLVSAGADGKIITWEDWLDLGIDRACVSPNQFPTGQHSGRHVYGLAVTKDGQTLVSRCIRSAKVDIWNIRQKRLIKTISVDPGGYGVDVSSKGLIAAGGTDGKIVLYDLKTGMQEPLVPKDVERGAVSDKLSAEVSAIQFSPDGAYLVVAIQRVNRRVIWDVEERRVVWQKDGLVGSVGWSPDGNVLVTAGRFLRIWNWNGQTANLRHESRGISNVTSVAVSDNEVCAVGSLRSGIQLWDMKAGKRIGEPIQVHSGYIWQLCFSSDGGSLFSVSGDDLISIWDVKSSRPRFRFSGHRDGAKSIALTHDDQLLITGGLYDGTIRFWPAPRRPAKP